MKRRVWAGLVVLVVAGLSYSAVKGLRDLNEHTLHPFDQTVFANPDYVVTTVPVEGREDLTVYVHPGDGPTAPVVYFLMGNAGTIAVHQEFLKVHEDAGRTVIAVGYRGGGGLPGTPSEFILKDDAVAAVDALETLVGPEHGPVILHGYSMGTGLAIYVAARREVGGLVIDAPYARICDLFFRRFGLSACMIPFFQKFDSMVDAPDVTEPVLIRHGEEDMAINIGEARRLEEALAGPVQFDALPGITHINIPSAPDYAEGMTRFIEALPLP